MEKAKIKEEKLRFSRNRSVVNTTRSKRSISLNSSGLQSPTYAKIVKPIRQFNRVISKNAFHTKNLESNERLDSNREAIKISFFTKSDKNTT
jgi:hypothetical protein